MFARFPHAGHRYGRLPPAPLFGYPPPPYRPQIAHMRPQTGSVSGSVPGMTEPTTAEPSAEPLVVLSMGGGIQSTTLALLCAAGVFRPPQVAVFADTGCEPEYVYATIRAVSDLVPFPVVTTTNRGRDLADDTAAAVNSLGAPGWVSIPAFVRRPNGKVGMAVRQCTEHYKLRPIERAIRAHMGITRLSDRNRADIYLGITTDEIARVRPNRNPYLTNRYPLLDAGWSRADCAKWLDDHHPNLRVGKSACVICPYRSDAGWARLRHDDPDGFRRAVAVDAAIRHTGGAAGERFLHSSARPLDQAVAEPAPTLFGGAEDAECSGGCFL